MQTTVLRHASWQVSASYTGLFCSHRAKGGSARRLGDQAGWDAASQALRGEFWGDSRAGVTSQIPGMVAWASEWDSVREASSVPGNTGSIDARSFPGGILFKFLHFCRLSFLLCGRERRAPAWSTSKAVAWMKGQNGQWFVRVSDGGEGDGSFSLHRACRRPSLVSLCH